MAHEKQRRVEYNCHAGKQFNYYCDDCALELFGWDNKNYVASANGWTWEVTRNGDEIDSAEIDLSDFTVEPKKKPLRLVSNDLPKNLALSPTEVWLLR